MRIDYRLNNKHQLTCRYRKYNWVAIDAFRGKFPFARTDWERPNSTQNFKLDEHAPEQPDQRGRAITHSLDQVFINVFTGTDLYKRSRTGINYPYIFPGKEIPDKIPTMNDRQLHRDRRRPVSGVVARADPHLLQRDDLCERPPHVQGRRVVEYSGEDDFDQINVSAIPGSTNNQNGRFEFLEQPGVAHRTRASPTRRWGCSATTRKSVSARSPSGARSRRTFRPGFLAATSNLTIEGGIRWVFWPPWYSTTNNIAKFDPRSTTRPTRRSSVRGPAGSWQAPL